MQPFCTGFFLKNKNNKRILSVQRGFYPPFFRKATWCRLPPPVPTQNGDGSSALFMSTAWNLATKSYPHRVTRNKSTVITEDAQRINETVCRRNSTSSEHQGKLCTKAGYRRMKAGYQR